MKTTDLTPFFIEARSHLKNWSKPQLLDILSSIPQLIPQVRIDWDRGAGEDWVSLSVGKQWIGIIRVDTPIAFFLDEYSDNISHLLASHNVKLIAVKSLSEEGFKLDLYQVHQIIPGGWHADPDAVDLDSLSIADLWYATI
ncbi:MAG: hypothetical protein AB4426_08835 [Xenococcaceae cyanobacterium]